MMWGKNRASRKYKKLLILDETYKMDFQQQIFIKETG
jgi:hypothetical protein